MSAKLIDGKSISADIRNELKHKINDLNKKESYLD